MRHRLRPDSVDIPPVGNRKFVRRIFIQWATPYPKNRPRKLQYCGLSRLGGSARLPSGQVATGLCWGIDHGTLQGEVRYRYANVMLGWHLRLLTPKSFRTLRANTRSGNIHAGSLQHLPYRTQGHFQHQEWKMFRRNNPQRLNSVVPASEHTDIPFPVPRISKFGRRSWAPC